jgi:hypothetical protein
MFVSTQDAIRIYARACRSWYGSRARKMALTRAHELQQRGDLEGAQVWRELADEIERGGISTRAPAGFFPPVYPVRGAEKPGASGT